jgi:hypothetical protein
MQERLREYENFHIVLWLMKDTCWLMEWKIAAVIMIIPTIFAAFHITWLGRKDQADLFHNLAVSHWICGNAVWMIGEFFFDDMLKPIARVFFAAGFLWLARYYFGAAKRKIAAAKKSPLLG